MAHISADGTRTTEHLQGFRAFDGTPSGCHSAVRNAALGGHDARPRAVPFYLALPLFIRFRSLSTQNSIPKWGIQQSSRQSLRCDFTPLIDRF